MTFRIRARERVAVPAPARHEPAGARAVRDRRRRQSAAGSVDERGRASIRPCHGGTDGQSRRGANLRIPCTTVGTNDFDGCPAHLPRDQRPEVCRASTSRRGRTCGSTAIRSTSKSRVDARRRREVNVRRRSQSGAARQRAASSRFVSQASPRSMSISPMLRCRARRLAPRRLAASELAARAAAAFRRSSAACCSPSITSSSARSDDPRVDRRRRRRSTREARDVFKAGARPRARTRRSCTRCAACGSTTKCCTAKASRCSSTRATTRSASA